MKQVAPIENEELRVSRVWRSELGRMILFLVLSVGTVILSIRFPSSIISGPLFDIAGYSIHLRLPVLWVLPFITLSLSFLKIFDVRYLLDDIGVEATEGILRWRKRVTRLNFTDIRSLETDQSLLGRFFDFGNLEIGTAASGDVEITLSGIGSPKSLQRLIQEQRDARILSAEQTAEFERRESESRKSESKESERQGPGDPNSLTKATVKMSPAV